MEEEIQAKTADGNDIQGYTGTLLQGHNGTLAPVAQQRGWLSPPCSWFENDTDTHNRMRILENSQQDS